ncbi:hypothetical protein MEE_01341 [Bartonella elizabethae F9251 = ATCC 49927]|uniref:Uncharacterized protein n=1 Tax=Bartonella elizabethae F9251 = ATCC 49927 TaxID=1094555 RepID=J0REW7_BAREL|nr:hypothetical protein [Bartonella elizabethae]EJF94444.1 hypothetical protein MEE_01341 [Bartonella elizabethae F9251 = ATCC 49927]VEJ41483.1 Uncharacterised protein [Bartonella elizabethae]
MMVSQEKEPLILAKNKGFSNISGQIPTGKEGDIIGPTVKDALFTVYFFSSESLSLRLLEPLEGGL